MHASFAFTTQHPGTTEQWLKDSQYLVVVTVPDEVSLIALVSQARALDVPSVVWHEPDRGNEATAIALGPGETARRLCGQLPLFGRELVVI